MFVLGTTLEGTCAALRAANRRAQTGTSVVLLVPCLTCDENGSRPADDSKMLIDQHRAMVLELCPTATIYVSVGRRPEEAFTPFFSGPSTVMIGGRRGTWWRPSPERQLARTLVRQGHVVMFEDLGAITETA